MGRIFSVFFAFSMMFQSLATAEQPVYILNPMLKTVSAVYGNYLKAEQEMLAISDRLEEYGYDVLAVRITFEMHEATTSEIFFRLGDKMTYADIYEAMRYGIVEMDRDGRYAAECRSIFNY